MYASKVFESQGLIQRSRTEIGTYKCQFCQRKEYKYHQGLNRHKKDCDMNPDKKRKSTESDEEADMQQKLHQSSANTNYKNIMATDCNDKKKIQKTFERMEPLAAGLLHQRFLAEDTQYNRDKEEFESKTRENEKVKKVLKSFEPESPPVVSSSSSGAASGGGGGVMGMLGMGARK
jgi:hypothetical protein